VKPEASPHDVDDGVHGSHFMEVNFLQRDPVHLGLGLTESLENLAGGRLDRPGQRAFLEEADDFAQMAVRSGGEPVLRSGADRMTVVFVVCMVVVLVMMMGIVVMAVLVGRVLVVVRVTVVVVLRELASLPAGGGPGLLRRRIGKNPQARGREGTAHLLSHLQPPAGKPEGAEPSLELRERQAGVEEGTEGHIATGSRERLEIRQSRHERQYTRSSREAVVLRAFRWVRGRDGPLTLLLARPYNPGSNSGKVPSNSRHNRAKRSSRGHKPPGRERFGVSIGNEVPARWRSSQT
jgi:hypothetical protein